jgi:hypothetical protein
MNYHEGQKVEFEVQSKGRRKIIRGIIALDVPAGMRPQQVNGYAELFDSCIEPAFSPKHRWSRTYIIRVPQGKGKRDKLYWPKIPNFKVIE